MATMKDIAEQAGVSQATVSRVLNGSSSVTPATKSHVMEWARQVEGLLIGFADSHSPSINEIRHTELPAVVITQTYEDLDCVAVNHFCGGEMAAKELIKLGVQRFVYQGNLDDEKYDGFLHALHNSGIHKDKITTLDLGNVWYHTQLRAYNNALKFVRENPFDSKTGVFAYNDLSAFSFIHAALDLEKRIPEDYSIIGFDDTFMCQIIRPTLTSIAQPKEEIGRAAINHLLARIDKKLDIKKESYLLPPRLIKREST
jgi:DNA-binding LacI/PurR family transcriptional regulator